MSIEVKVVDGREFKRCTCCNRAIGGVSCRYCLKTYKRPHMLAKHEAECYLNPNRKCPLCDNKGFYDDGFDYYFGGALRQVECPHCEEAKRRRNTCMYCGREYDGVWERALENGKDGVPGERVCQRCLDDLGWIEEAFAQ